MSTNLEAKLIFSCIKENNCELHIMKMLDRSFNVSVICLILLNSVTSSDRDATRRDQRMYRSTEQFINKQ